MAVSILMKCVHAVGLGDKIRRGVIRSRTGRHQPGCDKASWSLGSQQLRHQTRRCAAPGFWRDVRRASVTMLLLTGLAAPAAAVSPPDPAPPTDAPVRPNDPLSLILASHDAWTVSNTDAGCYLLSPQQKSNSGLAIGWRQKHEPGLFLISFALAVPTANLGEPVVVQAGGHQFEDSGRNIGFKLFFVPIDDTEMSSVLQELSDTGTLWLEVRHTWIAHGGRGLPAALASYRSTCAAGATRG
jgi:hypothetical protein